MVAFLFSDIEGSTVRWERHPGAMSQAVRRHDELIASIVAARGGNVFKTLGDGFCIAFDDAAAAVAAALDAQRALLQENWSDVDGLRVRMALHAGESEQRGSDHFGPSVNRVARLLAAGHGGQILVSGPLADALHSALPDSVSLRALGTFRLKDLQSPERIYQLVADDLPQVFPALRTLDAVPNNLPAQSTPLIGRSADVKAIVHGLKSSRLITVAGPGGVGKTRVALQAAADSVDRNEDGVWFVNLAPLNEPEFVASAMLAALDAGPAERGAEVSRLIDRLSSREALVLLDNCEQVVDEAAALITRILAACPRVSFIATSRELLHVSGEQVCRLGPLDTQDAVELFCERALAVAPHFEAAPRMQAIMEICERLDGIPLAIELAAARVRALNADEIAGRLNERFRLLSGGSRSALPRQQTLRALIDWSYDLLTGDEQRLLRHLGAFRGSFSLEGAAALYAPGEPSDEYEVLDVLTSLVDKSLISALAGRTTRYRMLESIREYALAKNVEAQAEAIVARRHAEYYAALAAQAYAEFDSRMPPDWLERFAPEVDNFRAALHWSLEDKGDRRTGAQLAADCGPVFLRLERMGEGLHWCEVAGGTADLAPETAGRLQYVASMLYNNLGSYPPALACAERAVSFYRASTDERGLVRALSQAAQQYARAHRFREAEVPAAEAIERARHLGEPRVLSSVLRRCAFSIPPADMERARPLFAEALETARRANESEEACLVLNWWADREASAGCFERALILGREGLECATGSSRMYFLLNIAGYAFAAGREDEAEPFAREALQLAGQAQHPLACAIAIAYTAPFHARHDPYRAAELFGYAAARIHEQAWGEEADRLALRNAAAIIESALGQGEFRTLCERGASLDLDHALASLSLTSAGR